MIDTRNPPLNLVNRVLLNSQAKSKATGIKKTRNTSGDSSSVSQSPVLPTPHPYYAITASGLGYLPTPPYFVPLFMQSQLSVQSGQLETRRQNLAEIGVRGSGPVVIDPDQEISSLERYCI